jgi:hypothetical protein
LIVTLTCFVPIACLRSNSQELSLICECAAGTVKDHVLFENSTRSDPFGANASQRSLKGTQVPHSQLDFGFTRHFYSPIAVASFLWSPSSVSITNVRKEAVNA